MVNLLGDKNSQKPQNHQPPSVDRPLVIGQMIHGSHWLSWNWHCFVSWFLIGSEDRPPIARQWVKAGRVQGLVILEIGTMYCYPQSGKVKEGRSGFKG